MSNIKTIAAGLKSVAERLATLADERFPVRRGDGKVVKVTVPPNEKRKALDDEDGVWRTVRGRRIFIKEGESLSTAMKRSGIGRPTTSDKLDAVRDDDSMMGNTKDYDPKFAARVGQEFGGRLKSVEGGKVLESKATAGTRDRLEKLGFKTVDDVPGTSWMGTTRGLRAYLDAEKKTLQLERIGSDWGVGSAASAAVDKAYRDIVKRGRLDDRREYDADDLKKAHGLSDSDAKALYDKIQAKFKR